MFAGLRLTIKEDPYCALLTAAPVKAPVTNLLTNYVAKVLIEIGKT
jgi:hypothetical protein